MTFQKVKEPQNTEEHEATIKEWTVATTLAMTLDLKMDFIFSCAIVFNRRIFFVHFGHEYVFVLQNIVGEPELFVRGVPSKILSQNEHFLVDELKFPNERQWLFILIIKSSIQLDVRPSSHWRREAVFAVNNID